MKYPRSPTPYLITLLLPRLSSSFQTSYHDILSQTQFIRYHYGQQPKLSKRWMVNSKLAESVHLTDDDDDEKSSRQTSREQKVNFFQKFLLDLANLSLRDYQWRSAQFKTIQADRQMEESLARMMGDDPTYIRPMDAGDEKRGPLGQAEKNAVTWLFSVIEEEGSRAKLITERNGTLIRPIDLDDSGGPLSRLERAAVSFLNSIKTSENERVINRLLRPMDVSEDKRGPLGEAEANVVATLNVLAESEKTRYRMASFRNETVRPMDVPGPLGEIEKWAMDFVSAERKRALERRDVYEKSRKVLRPKDSTRDNPLGMWEITVETIVEKLRLEENERWKNLKQIMEENRPMEVKKDSVLGVVETIFVGIVRAPQMAISVFSRVAELMQSEKLNVTQSEEKIEVGAAMKDNDIEDWGQWR